MKNFASIFIFALLFTGIAFPIFSQTPERKKSIIKNFGSSLKRTPKQNLSRKKEENDSADEDVIRINTNLVVLDCLVVDAKGNVISDLTLEDFSIAEDNQSQQIEFFSLGNNAKVPRSIVLIIDYSGSQKPYIERSVEAAKILDEFLLCENKTFSESYTLKPSESV